MKNEKIQNKLIKQPYYEGGDKALKEFINQNLQYPVESQKNGVEGDVHLKYDIDFKGVVIDVKIIGGLDQPCNEEATRVVKLLRFIVPRTPRHLKLTFHKTISIHFRVNSPTSNEQKILAPFAPSIKITYTVVNHPKKNIGEIKQPFTYQYTIKS